METEYTKGFRAGQAYENKRLFEYLMAFNKDCDKKGHCEKCDFRAAIAGLIYGTHVSDQIKKEQ